jgi:hypothetical protein
MKKELARLNNLICNLKFTEGEVNFIKNNIESVSFLPIEYIVTMGRFSPQNIPNAIFIYPKEGIKENTQDMGIIKNVLSQYILDIITREITLTDLSNEINYEVKLTPYEFKIRDEKTISLTVDIKLYNLIMEDVEDLMPGEYVAYYEKTDLITSGFIISKDNNFFTIRNVNDKTIQFTIEDFRKKYYDRKNNITGLWGTNHLNKLQKLFS